MPRYTNRQQLLSTKTVAEIAEQVHNAEQPKLIKRQFVFGSFDPLKNLWAQLPDETDICPYEYSDLALFEPRITCISTLRIVDNATVPNAGSTDNPVTMRDESIQAAEDGTNVIAPVYQLQGGKRLSDQVLVHALSAIVRLRVVRTAADIYTDKVTFKFGFYQWTKIDAVGYLDAGAVPDIKTICKWQPIGFSNQLDNLKVLGPIQGLPYATENLNMILNSEKVRTLVEKTVTLNVSSIQGSVNCRLINMYKEFKDAIKIMYSPRDQTGQTHLNHKIFFACRSNLPGIQTANIEPRLMACTKMYYSNFL